MRLALHWFLSVQRLVSALLRKKLQPSRYLFAFLLFRGFRRFFSVGPVNFRCPFARPGVRSFHFWFLTFRVRLLARRFARFTSCFSLSVLVARPKVRPFSLSVSLRDQVLCKLTDQILSSLIADADLIFIPLRMLIYQLFLLLRILLLPLQIERHLYSL